MAFSTYFPQNYLPYQPQAQIAQQMPTQMPIQNVPQPPIGQSSLPAPTTTAMRLVASKAEVIAAQIPFDGSTSYFIDTSNGKIYAKTFSFVDGTAPIVTYIREVEQQVQYATLEDINSLKAEIEALKTAKLEKVDKTEKTVKAAKKNDADE